MDSALAPLVVARSTRPGSPDHGQQHWKAVAWAGLGLARQVDGCDAELVLLFALLHDTQRFNESRDPEHGLRAALFAQELRAEGVLALDDERLDVLADACTRHDQGFVSDDPTTGACWDADRLNLWRVGITPEARLLSTPPARQRELIADARSFHGLAYTWDDLFDGFAQLAP
ncbi:MAG: hypothetical protein LH654_13655 [Thermoleophilia bacterium]|nr:hypothetical protein [Thermoleophilia bacterium]